MPIQSALRDGGATRARYHRRMATQILFGFHAATIRLKTAPRSVLEIHVDATRRDQRMRQFIERANAAGARLIESDDARLQKLSGTSRHQGVVARVEALAVSHSLDDTLDAIEGAPDMVCPRGLSGHQGRVAECPVLHRWRQTHPGSDKTG